MQLSKYTIQVSDYPEEGKCLLCNTRTQALVKVDRLLNDVIDYLPDIEGLSEKILSDLDVLYQNGILVLDDQDDREKINQFFKQLKHDQIDSSLNLTILTTYACNFNCGYCFEKGADEKKRMTFDVAETVIGWIKAKVVKESWKKVHLTFYGGEPLLNIGVIECIAAELAEWCREHQVKFGFLLQTNGYLLNRDLINHLKLIGLTGVQVSLDGIGVDHDKHRCSINGQGTFDVIYKNILENIDAVKIGISTSYEGCDISHIDQMLAFLKGDGILEKIDPFMFSAVQPSLGKEGVDRCFRVDCLANYDDEVLIDASRAIDLLMGKYGIPKKGGMLISTCSLTRENGGLTVDPYGDIFTCNMMLGHKQFSVGNIFTDDIFNKDFSDLDVWKKCPEDCFYLPMCGGGCRFMSFIETQDFSKLSCKRKYLDAVVEDMIKTEYEKIIKY